MNTKFKIGLVVFCVAAFLPIAALALPTVTIGPGFSQPQDNVHLNAYATFIVDEANFIKDEPTVTISNLSSDTYSFPWTFSVSTAQSDVFLKSFTFDLLFYGVDDLEGDVQKYITEPNSVFDGSLVLGGEGSDNSSRGNYLIPSDDPIQPDDEREFFPESILINNPVTGGGEVQVGFSTEYFPTGTPLYFNPQDIGYFTQLVFSFGDDGYSLTPQATYSFDFIFDTDPAKYGNLNDNPTVVPEPSTIILMGFGIAMASFFSRKRLISKK